MKKECKKKKLIYSIKYPFAIIFSILRLLLVLPLLNHEVLTFDTFIDVFHIVCASLEVCGSIVALGNEDVVSGTILDWLV